MVRGLAQVPDDEPALPERDFRDDPVLGSRVLREDALEFLLADRGAIVAQHFVAPRRRVRERGGLSDLACGEVLEELARSGKGACGRAGFNRLLGYRGAGEAEKKREAKPQLFASSGWRTRREAARVSCARRRRFSS